MADTENDKQPSWGRWIAEKALFPIVAAVIASCLTFLWTSYNGRLRELKYTVVSASGLFQRPELPGRDIKLLIDNKPIDNISTVSVSVFNNSDRDFEDVPLQLSFTSDDRTIPKVAYAIAVNLAERQPMVPETQPNAGSTYPLRYQYTLKVLNRAGNRAIWFGTYVFEGSKAPSVDVTVSKIGLTTSVGEVGNGSGSMSDALSYVIAILSFVFVISVFGAMAPVFRRRV